MDRLFLLSTLQWAGFLAIDKFWGKITSEGTLKMVCLELKVKARLDVFLKKSD